MPDTDCSECGQIFTINLSRANHRIVDLCPECRAEKKIQVEEDKGEDNV